ncbi:hypothetical protein QTL86_04140 [Cellulosilyticum sp. ST5]|uniref:hypothetical protein n=1 Tax=Cellulosilyticum sp. ST5 TaxID=3055805 RepID=UPI0039773FA1
MLENVGAVVDLIGGVQTIFSAQNEVNESTKIRQNCLVLRECKAKLFNSDNPYSELDESTFSLLNYNDYGYGWMNIEFCFDMVEMYAYAPFYAGCFAIRTNNGITSKLNGHPKSKCASKINCNNQIVVGITYYFRDEEERTKILSASKIAIEGNIAFKKKKPVYGVLCFLAKKEDGWHMEESNTLLRLDGVKITNLIH